MLSVIKKCGILFVVAIYSQSLLAANIADYSVLPESMNSTPDLTPNILVILDNSSSMRLDSTGNWVGAHNSSSRSFQVREALRDVIDDNIGEVNISLMTFGGDPVEYTSNTANVVPSGCGDYSGCGNSINMWDRALTGKGFLLESMTPLDTTYQGRLDTLLAAEPELPTLDEVSPNFNKFAPTTNLGFFTSASSFLEAGTIISQGGRPLRGALESAHDYLVSQQLTSSEYPSGGTINYPGYDANVSGQCRPFTYVIVITDGVPNTNNTGTYLGSNDPTNSAVIAETALTDAAAETLANAGVNTYIIAHNVSSTGASATLLNQIAQKGANENAHFTNSSSEISAIIQGVVNQADNVSRSSSGISVFSNSSDAFGSVVQSIYTPLIEGTLAGNDVSVAWTSTLSAFFIDDFGYFREDGNDAVAANGVLDGYTVDPAFTIRFDEDDQQVYIQRLSVSNPGKDTFSQSNNGSEQPITALNPIWDASEVLSDYAQNSGAAVALGTVNRDYDSKALPSNGYRHIFTWLPDNPTTNNIDAGAEIPFIYDSGTTPASKSINQNNFTMFAPESTNESDAKIEVENIIRFIRGEEGIAGLRNRSTDSKTYLLGDIVHSTATQIDEPSEFYHIFNNDSSYRAFYNHYRDRRRMVYVGSNDGLLHAFNAGFWNPATQTFEKSSSSDTTEHELGAELWAYAPYNLLPQLKFLSNPNYSSNYHVAFMDGPVQVFDVQAFDPTDADHPNGWGTILVAGMRLGGGEYSDIDHDNDSNTATIKTRSAYVVLDVTDPSEPPTVIAEISDDNLGYTTGMPTVVREGKTKLDGTPDDPDWYLVFGSGPTDLQSATSNQKARIYRYKLNDTRGFDSNFNGTQEFGENNSFVGDLMPQDWNNDYTHETVYFGTSTDGNTNTDATNILGGMYRYHPDSSGSTISKLLDTERPVMYRPAIKSLAGKDWVFFGTGRYLTSDDTTTTEGNTFYGVQEPVDSTTGDRNYATVLPTNLADVSNTTVKDDGTLANGPSGQTTFNELRSHILGSKAGWKSDYATRSPSEKTSAAPLTFLDLLLYTSYQPPVPDNDICTDQFGESFLHVVDLVTGTAAFAESFDGPLGKTGTTVNRKVSLGAGNAVQLLLNVSKDPANSGKEKVSVIASKDSASGGENIQVDLDLRPQRSGRASWLELEIQ